LEQASKTQSEAGPDRATLEKADNSLKFEGKWDGYPDGTFSATFTDEEYAVLGGLWFHWCSASNGGYNGDPKAKEGVRGKGNRRKCLGVISCESQGCSIVSRIPTKGDAQQRHLDKPCICGARRALIRCNATSKTLKYAGGWYFAHEGTHTHGRPPPLHLTRFQKESFQELVVSNPHLGAYALMVGAPRLDGERKSVTNISPIFNNMDRVRKERQKVKKSYGISNGRTFISAFRDFTQKYPGYLFRETLGDITVISIQSPFMLSQLVKDEVLDGPVNGTVNDATASFFELSEDLLLMTSTFSGDLMQWVPAMASYSNGATTQHFYLHFLALFESIAREVERQGSEVRDDLFLGVSIPCYI
jgi:hypothetical protein